MKRNLLLSFVYLFVFALLSNTVAPFSEEKWTVDDVLLSESASQFHVSPEGNQAVWVQTSMDKNLGKNVSNIFLSDLATGRQIQLTRGKKTHSSPLWSPDGKLVAFLRSRPASKNEDAKEKKLTRIWLMDSAGGEPWLAAKLERSVKKFEWKDEETIAFISQEAPSLYEKEIEELKDTSKVVEDSAHEPPVRIFLLDTSTSDIQRITQNKDWIENLAVSPDGKWAATIHRRSLSYTFDHNLTPALFLTNLNSGQVIPVEPDRRMVAREIFWQKDSQGFYYSTEYSNDPHYFTATVTRLNHYDLEDNSSTAVDLGWENGLGGRGASFHTTSEGFIALLADGLHYKLGSYRRAGQRWSMSTIEGTHSRNIFSWVLAQDAETLIYNYSTASTPTQWFSAKLNGAQITESKQITSLNPSFQKKPKHRTELIKWKGANGDDIDGVLYYPLGYIEGKKYPLMLSIHGGPTGTDYDSWSQTYSTPKILLSQKGAFVLKVNYHGSGNYGLKWAESICCGRYYDLERVDIENGVDFLISQGLVDPDRLGTMGWSNGAILSTELITRSRRYKVASAGAGDVEWISDWGNVSFGASFDNYYFGKAPYEDPEFYIEKSPYFRLKDVTTPTIIYTGTEDVNVPPSQSWSHYRVMQQATDTPVRFILFPGEPHGLRKYQHQKRKLEEDLAWFDKYLFGTREEPHESLKEGSPLDIASQRLKFGKVDGEYGVSLGGILAPEIVSFKGIEIGRFEVTRAQYKQFSPDYVVAVGTENFPASGIRFEEATAYAKWLSEKTGRSYRIPGQDEVEALYTMNPSKDNTLDYWAGYSPNPDDVIRLTPTIESLEGDAPLLREVGTFPPQGDEQLVFDLGGNAAEWVISVSGEGVLIGGSADRPANSRSNISKAGEDYRGFRVVRGGKTTQK